jgi:hypothetical protein
MSRRSSAASIRTARPFLPVTSWRSTRANWVASRSMRTNAAQMLAVRLRRLLRRRLLRFGWRINRSGDRCGDPPDQPPSADRCIGVEAVGVSNRDNSQNYGPHDRTTDAVTRIRTAQSIHSAWDLLLLGRLTHDRVLPGSDRPPLPTGCALTSSVGGTGIKRCD